MPVTPVGLLAQLLVLLLPSLPFLVIPIPFYYYCSDHLVTGFHMMFSLWPLQGVLLLAGFIVPLLWLNAWRRGGRLSSSRMALLLALTLGSMGYSFWEEPTGDVGLRLWERDELAPRVEAFRELAHKGVTERAPVEVAGYGFPRAENAPEGILLYTVVGGGPWPGWGVFVPRDPTKEARLTLSGRRITRSSSVAGLYWFMEGP